ncbi:MAG: hypothetical protein ACRCZF_15315 [Gemmataceae bacterium]
MVAAKGKKLYVVEAKFGTQARETSRKVPGEFRDAARTQSWYAIQGSRKYAELTADAMAANADPVRKQWGERIQEALKGRPDPVTGQVMEVVYLNIHTKPANVADKTADLVQFIKK